MLAPPPPPQSPRMPSVALFDCRRGPKWPGATRSPPAPPRVNPTTGSATFLFSVCDLPLVALFNCRRWPKVNPVDATHISRDIGCCFPRPLITADLFRSVVRSPSFYEVVGSTTGSATFLFPVCDPLPCSICKRWPTWPIHANRRISTHI